MTEPWVSVEDVAAHLGVAKDSVYQWIQGKGLPAHKIGKLKKETLNKVEREKLKLASRSLLEELQRLIAPIDQWTQKEQKQAEVEVFILDHVFQGLPTPPFTAAEKESAAKRAYRHIWQQSTSGLVPKQKST